MRGPDDEIASIQGAFIFGRSAEEALIRGRNRQGCRSSFGRPETGALTQGIGFGVKSSSVANVPARTLLSSSMAEHSAVNRRVVGSSPT